MRQVLHNIILLTVIACFFTSLLRISSLLSSEMNEEQVEIIVKYNGNEEEELHDFDVNTFFKDQINVIVHCSIDDLWNATRYLEKNYAEPHLDTPYSPPEFKA